MCLCIVQFPYIRLCAVGIFSYIIIAYIHPHFFRLTALFQRVRGEAEQRWQLASEQMSAVHAVIKMQTKWTVPQGGAIMVQTMQSDVFNCLKIFLLIFD